MANLLSDDAVARMSAVVRWFEAQGANGPQIPRKTGRGNAQPTVTCRIVSEVLTGDVRGLYETEEVRWFDDELGNPTSASWQTVVDGRELTVLELNNTEGIADDTIIFATLKAAHFPAPTGTDPYKTDSQWVFMIGGGGSDVVPIRILSKVTGVHYKCEVYANGRYTDAGVVVPLTETNKDFFAWQYDTSATIPSGTYTYGLAVGDHYEGQVPVWLC